MSRNRGRTPVALLLWRGLLVCGVLLLGLSLAAPAAAHDNLGGDEMSMAIAIFIAGMVTVIGACLALVWAVRSGQFSNIEQAKYTMLEDADDLDALPEVAPPPRAPRPAQGGSHAAH